MIIQLTYCYLVFLFAKRDRRKFKLSDVKREFYICNNLYFLWKNINSLKRT